MEIIHKTQIVWVGKDELRLMRDFKRACGEKGMNKQMKELIKDWLTKLEGKSKMKTP